MVRIFSQYVSAKSLLLMFVESLLIVAALVVAVRLRFWRDPAEITAYIIFPDFFVQCVIVVLVCLACFYYNDLYDLRVARGPVDRILRVEQSIGAASLLLGLVYFLFPGLLLSRGVFLIGMGFVTLFIMGGRKLMDSTWHLTTVGQNVLILGTGELAEQLAGEIAKRPDLNMKLFGFVAPTQTEMAAAARDGLPVLGCAEDLEEIAGQHSISRIVVALEDRRGVLPIRELVTLRVRGIFVEDAPSALSALTGRVSLRIVRPSWFVFSDGFHRSRWTEVVKRTLDLACGTVGLLLSLPVMALVALAIKLDSKGPLLYRQTRVGRMSKTFEVLKFRSMVVDAERENGVQWAAVNDPRVTGVGGFLRKYRLDELPQFINVIRGDMSFVGPRPERPHFVEELRKSIPYYDERHSVRPGLTGWAQVQYEYGSSVEDAFKKLEYDLFYLKNMSLSFDLAIIFKTIRIVLGGHGGR
jgi:sugar transferase (PEP-CTERM system associated)